MIRLRLLLIVLLALRAVGASCQDVSRNYVKSVTMLDSAGRNSVTEVQYYDALGRPDLFCISGVGGSIVVYSDNGAVWRMQRYERLIGGIPSPGPYYMLSSRKTEYFGSFIREDGVVTKYLFDGGYCTFTEDGVPVAHYYTRDHLGNVREVVDGDGTVITNAEQKTASALGEINDGEVTRTDHFGKHILMQSTISNKPVKKDEEKGVIIIPKH